MTTQAPSIGRIVHYQLADEDIRHATAAGPPRDRGVEVGDVFPAMIVSVTEHDGGDDLANLQVFLDGGATYWVTDKLSGDDPGSYAWPKVSK